MKKSKKELYDVRNADLKILNNNPDDFWSDVSTIGENAFSDCTNLKNIEIPEGVTLIDSHAFLGCDSLTQVIMPKSMSYIYKDAFEDCDFKYATRLKNGKIILSKELLKINNKGVSYISLEDAAKVFIDFDLQILLTNNNFVKISDIVPKLIERKKKVPYLLAKLFFEKGKEKDFIDDFEWKNFKNIKRIMPKDIHWSDETSLYVFAYNIGCFSNNPLLNQKANAWLEERVTPDKRFGLSELHFDRMCEDFDDWSPTGYNEEFSEFLFGKNVEKGTRNFKEILEEPNYGLFIKKVYDIYLDPNINSEGSTIFRDVKTGKLMFRISYNSTDKEGNAVLRTKNRIPTVELFSKYFLENTFLGIYTEEDEQISKELNKWIGMGQEEFDKAKSIMKEFHSKKISSNIVGKHLCEASIILDEYNKKTDDLAREGLDNAREIVNKLSSCISEEFTYEWLEKNDPMNFCLGLYCNCCANLAGVGYGIMRSNFVHPDVQNLVIKNSKGNPVAKSTLYVNKEQGYGIFNNVEVSSNITDSQKEKIYKKYMEGIRTFAEEYNRVNPDHPLKKINVGISANDLEKQIVEGRKPSEILKGINFGKYGIKDQKFEGNWSKGNQYLVWEKEEIKR